ncbi:hypothetical protein CF15_06925 [Pyrodictium occultum]|uniref:Anaphase-promoting complex subunit 4 WD40 domain-containing protein n=1 Tax=Pyrodictium occultum TaxID=2309 RepID=A0A0V8RWQ4_PYROC|nr:hypothetical protein CF15_06925 [Pyrodictium occultum]
MALARTLLLLAILAAALYLLKPVHAAEAGSSTPQPSWSVILGYSVTRLAWNTSSDHLLVGTSGGAVLLDRSGHKVWGLLPKEPVYDVAFSPDGRLVAVAAGRIWHYVYVLDAATGREAARIFSIWGDLASVCWVSTGFLVAGESGRPRLHLYKLVQGPTGSLEPRSLAVISLGDGDYGGVASIACIPGKEQVVVGMRNGYIALVSLISGKPVWVSPSLGGQLAGMALGGDVVAAAVIDKSHGVSRLYLLSLARGEVMASYSVETLITSIAVTGNYLIAGDLGGDLYLFQYGRGGLELVDIDRVSLAPITAIAVSPDGSQLAIGVEKGVVASFNAADFIYERLAKIVSGVSTVYTLISVAIDDRPVVLFRTVIDLPSVLSLNVGSYNVSFDAVLEQVRLPCNVVLEVNVVELKEMDTNMTVATMLLDKPLEISCHGIKYGYQESNVSVHGRAVLALSETSSLRLLGDREHVLVRLQAAPYIAVYYGGRPGRLASEIRVDNLVPATVILAKYFSRIQGLVAPAPGAATRTVTTTVTTTVTRTVTTTPAGACGGAATPPASSASRGPAASAATSAAGGAWSGSRLAAAGIVAALTAIGLLMLVAGHRRRGGRRGGAA